MCSINIGVRINLKNNMKLQLTKERIYAIALVLAVLVIGGLLFKSCEDNKALRSVKTEESNLRKALTDTLTHFQTKEGDWGVEKKTLQADLSTLKDNNLNLNANQKALIKEVERQNKNATTIAAALIELTAKVEGLTNDNAIVTDSTVNFPYDSEELKYSLTVYNIKPLDFKKPRLVINTLEFPNTQTVNFNWKDDKKQGYPVSFSVINTNKYFKVSDIQSYVIPEIKKEELKPTFWNKMGKFGKSTGGKVVIFGAGVIIGGLAFK